MIRDYCSGRSWRKRFPFTIWLPQYSFRYVINDFIAGLTVALTVIPQSLAYASIAKLHIQYGLYSAFMGCFVYFIFGTSKDITVGPTAILSLLVATYDDPIKPGSDYNDPKLAIILAFMCGVIQFVMGVLHLGSLTGFISTPVISGFTSASAITIAAGQAKHLLGLSFSSDTFFESLVGIFAHIRQTNGWDLLMGLSSMVVLLLLQKIQRDSSLWMSHHTEDTPGYLKVVRKSLWFLGTARNAVIVGCTAILVWSLDTAGYAGKISTTGNVTEGIPTPSLPDFADFHFLTVIRELNVGLIIVPLIAYLEAIAIGKAFARKNGYRVEPNQEIIALGLCNIAGSFFSSYPVTGSFSRTAINSQSGVKTPAGGVVTGVLVLLSLQFLTPLFQFIPKAALAAVIITAVLKMFNYKMFVKLWQVSKLDLIPLTVTFVASLFLPVQYGTIIGVVVDLIILLYPIARPEIKAVSPSNAILKQEDNLFLPSDRSSPLVQIESCPVLVVQVDRSVRYPSAENLVEKLNNIRESKVYYQQHVIFDFSRVCEIDYTAVESLSDAIADFAKAGVKLYFVHVKLYIHDMLHRANIPGLEIFPSVQEAMQSLSGSGDT